MLYKSPKQKNKNLTCSLYFQNSINENENEVFDESYINEYDDKEIEEEWKPPMPIFAYKRLDGMEGRIRLLKRGTEKRTQIPYALIHTYFTWPVYEDLIRTQTTN